MHPALRKGPLFYKKHPPIFHCFFAKLTPHFISCLRAWCVFCESDRQTDRQTNVGTYEHSLLGGE